MRLIDDILAKAFGSDQSLDQVLRLRAFRINHPEWVLFRDHDMHCWRACKLLSNSSEDVVRRTLKELLDALDKKVGV
jgi:hypothetical protein